jgi:hypothetical protein
MPPFTLVVKACVAVLALLITAGCTQPNLTTTSTPTASNPFIPTPIPSPSAATDLPLSPVNFWFGSSYGVYLYTPTGGFQKVLAFSFEPSEAGAITPAGFCV